MVWACVSYCDNYYVIGGFTTSCLRGGFRSIDGVLIDDREIVLSWHERKEILKKQLLEGGGNDVYLLQEVEADKVDDFLDMVGRDVFDHSYAPRKVSFFNEHNFLTKNL